MSKKKLYSRKIVTFLKFLVIYSYFINNIIAQEIYTALPKKIKKSEKYIFYLHGKIVEEQGPYAISKEYGKYEYFSILNALSKGGNVISEIRPKNTDSEMYAYKVVKQIDSLLKSKVKPENITVLGASKGAWITIMISSKLKNKHVNYIIMGICGDDYDYSQDMFKMSGRILSIYDNTDSFGGSCSKILNTKTDFIMEKKEIKINLGLGHGYLYRPYNEWIIPALEWTKK